MVSTDSSESDLGGFSACGAGLAVAGAVLSSGEGLAFAGASCPAGAEAVGAVWVAVWAAACKTSEPARTRRTNRSRSMRNFIGTMDPGSISSIIACGLSGWRRGLPSILQAIEHGFQFLR